jgi:hypothetical protein
MDEPEVCVHCQNAIFFGEVVVGEWAHWHRDTWCHDRNGFCATPLRRATPTYHGRGDVL